MKKILFVLLIAILMLAGCGSTVHKNVDENMAADTNQILDIFDGVIKDERDFTDKEIEIMNSYYSYYQSKYDTEKLTNEEIKIFLDVKPLIEAPDIYLTLESDKERYQKHREGIKNVIKTGNY